MSSVESDLTSKIGPLPAWAWGAGVVGGIIVFRHMRASSQAANTPNPATDPTDPTTAAPDPFATAEPGMSGYDPFNGVNASSPYANVGQIPSGVPAPTTDAQWARLAGDYLMSKGDDPTLVQTALSKYLAGETLTSAEQAVVNQALSAFGSPPEGVMPVASPTPTPAPTPAPTTGTTSPTPTTTTPTTTAGYTGTAAIASAPHLTIQATANHRLHLAWSKLPRATFYVIQKDHGTIFAVRTGTTYVTGPLKKGSHHTYQVRGGNARGLGPWSHAVTVVVR